MEIRFEREKDSYDQQKLSGEMVTDCGDHHTVQYRVHAGELPYPHRRSGVLSRLCLRFLYSLPWLQGAGDQAEAGEVYTISNLVRTDEGELQTLMLGPDRAVFGEFSGTGEMVLQISQSGRYRIRVSAQEHQGSFALSWSVDEQGVTQK